MIDSWIELYEIWNFEAKNFLREFYLLFRSRLGGMSSGGMMGGSSNGMMGGSSSGMMGGSSSGMMGGSSSGMMGGSSSGMMGGSSSGMTGGGGAYKSDRDKFSDKVIKTLRQIVILR